MKKSITLLAYLITAVAVYSQTIYSKSYGVPGNPAIVFLHGGPGYNSVGFEVSTASKLASQGFHVVVYDRRGEGRSESKKAKYNFDEAFNDLNVIYKKYNLEKATLIGHSFGGIMGTLYSEKFPKKVESLVLVGVPISMQETFKTIISSCKGIYKEDADTKNLEYIYLIEGMDTTSLEYATYAFAHAMQNGFYTPQNPSKEALSIYDELRSNSTFQKYGSSMSAEPTSGFWANENYTTVNLTNNIIATLKEGIPIYGLYGKEDGLFSKEQIEELQQTLPKENLRYLDNCSHNVFIDQQSQFIESLGNWVLK